MCVALEKKSDYLRAFPLLLSRRPRFYSSDQNLMWIMRDRFSSPWKMVFFRIFLANLTLIRSGGLTIDFPALFRILPGGHCLPYEIMIDSFLRALMSMLFLFLLNIKTYPTWLYHISTMNHLNTKTARNYFKTAHGQVIGDRSAELDSGDGSP